MNSLPAVRARKMVDDNLDAENAYKLGNLQYAIVADSEDLAVYDYSPLSEKAKGMTLTAIESAIAELTIAAERIKK